MTGPIDGANRRDQTLPGPPAAGVDRRSIGWLLAGNALTLGLALWQDASVASLLWPF